MGLHPLRYQLSGMLYEIAQDGKCLGRQQQEARHDFGYVDIDVYLSLPLLQ